MKFTQSHEWILNEGKKAKVGISQFAKKELGEVVFIELPQIGQAVEAGEEVAVLESTKAAADIYSPLSGKISSINAKAKEDLTLINSDPQGEGWLFEIEFSNDAELSTLLDEKSYLEITQ